MDNNCPLPQSSLQSLDDLPDSYSAFPDSHPDHRFTDILSLLEEDSPSGPACFVPDASLSGQNLPALSLAVQPSRSSLGHYDLACVQLPPVSASDELFLAKSLSQSAGERSWMPHLTLEPRVDPSTTWEEGPRSLSDSSAAVRANLGAQQETKTPPLAFEAASIYHMEQPHHELDQSEQVIQWAPAYPLNLSRSHDISETSDMQQLTATPSSSTSSEAAVEGSSYLDIGDHRTSLAGATQKQRQEQPHSQNKSKEKLSRTKRPKKERGPKFVFKTRSDVEIIDDGFKWRKYGQKAVKNSPFPRSYYKCTNKQCRVKKHVERQADQSSYVLTTYEGLHNHAAGPTPVQLVHASMSNLVDQGRFPTLQPIQMELLLSSQSNDYLAQLEQIAQLRMNSEARRDEGLLEDVIPCELRTHSTSQFDSLSLPSVTAGTNL